MRCRPDPGPLWGSSAASRTPRAGQLLTLPPRVPTPFSAQGARFHNKSVLPEATRSLALSLSPPLRQKPTDICGRAGIILGSKLSPCPSPACGETEAQSGKESIVDRTPSGFWRLHPQKTPQRSEGSQRWWVLELSRGPRLNFCMCTHTWPPHEAALCSLHSGLSYIPPSSPALRKY